MAAHTIDRNAAEVASRLRKLFRRYRAEAAASKNDASTATGPQAKAGMDKLEEMERRSNGGKRG